MSEEEKIFCTYTCKECESAFVREDECGVESIPPDYLFCPDCVSKGLKNKNYTKERELFIRKDNLMGYVLNNIPEDRAQYSGWIIKEALNRFDREVERGKRFNSRSIMNEVLEILEYHIEEQNNVE